MRKVLSIAGSDCSGGAGVQADLKTFAAHGVYGMSVIVSVVAENTARVIDSYDVPPEAIRQQMNAVFEDIPPDAVKIGMLPTPACMEAVAEELKKHRPEHVVVDPVMVAKNGCPLMKPDAAGTFARLILPFADVLTPNLPEAKTLTGVSVRSVPDMQRAAEKLCSMGAKSVVVKGGHFSGDALDVLYDGEKFYRFTARRVPTKNTHGTGCTFSSAIASNLALGYALPEAVERAKHYVTVAIEHSLNIGKGCGPTHHFYELYLHGLQKGV